MEQKIICFGETLWDILPGGKMPGGAPMNVAIHLRYNGFHPVVISRVGNDALGRKLTAFLESKRIATHWIQQDETYPTGVVEANISDKNQVTYTIQMPVAWDFIRYEEKAAGLVADSDVFIYGSLAARNKTTRNTLQLYLTLAKLKVCDVNLRPPYDSAEIVKPLLYLADIVKMNYQELEEILNWFGVPGDEQQQMLFLKQEFGLQLLIVTRGEKGAAVLDDQGYTEHQGFRVEVQDTIGSGDAFLASFLTNYLKKVPISEALKSACLLGAFVATQHGATPTYDPREIESHFLSPDQEEAL